MPPERFTAAAVLNCIAAAALLAGCAVPLVPAPAPALPPAPAPAPAPAAPEPLPEPPPAPPAPPTAEEIAAVTLPTMLRYADWLRTLTVPELAHEISRIGDPGVQVTRQMQLALALTQSRVPADLVRAQALLQRVLAQNTPDARAQHPLARLLTAQYNEQRRVEEQAERQAQQLRDAQRRIDQLNERLEAVRAMERSLPSRPPNGGPPGPAPR